MKKLLIFSAAGAILLASTVSVLSCSGNTPQYNLKKIIDENSAEWINYIKQQNWHFPTATDLKSEDRIKIWYRDYVGNYLLKQIKAKSTENLLYTCVKDKILNIDMLDFNYWTISPKILFYSTDERYFKNSEIIFLPAQQNIDEKLTNYSLNCIESANNASCIQFNALVKNNKIYDDHILKLWVFNFLNTQKNVLIKLSDELVGEQKDNFIKYDEEQNKYLISFNLLKRNNDNILYTIDVKK